MKTPHKFHIRFFATGSLLVLMFLSLTSFLWFGRKAEKKPETKAQETAAVSASRDSLRLINHQLTLLGMHNVAIDHSAMQALLAARLCNQSLPAEYSFSLSGHTSPLQGNDSMTVKITWKDMEVSGTVHPMAKKQALAGIFVFDAGKMDTSKTVDEKLNFLRDLEANRNVDLSIKNAEGDNWTRIQCHPQ